MENQIVFEDGKLHDREQVLEQLDVRSLETLEASLAAMREAVSR